ncbi:unnamed protein product [Paramecium primaurelia]|uniref:Uncharacterized protein n=1 Tax=Paramecium primaurelia TaxID=5886 RepID=A0A8S1L9P8_PARPR|nr:unnamed protein product [Paramecium primaurelia]CAD8117056.1 unnamed protein product [Paramecium primaurelia]
MYLINIYIQCLQVVRILNSVPIQFYQIDPLLQDNYHTINLSLILLIRRLFQKLKRIDLFLLIKMSKHLILIKKLQRITYSNQLIKYGYYFDR